MNSYYKVAILLAGLVLIVAYSSDSLVSHQPIEVTVPAYQLSVVDSFGVELGDSITMIGSINGFCYHPDGSILVLDSVFGLVRVISESGEIRFFGRPGEGPGEFIFPRGICAMQDGRILVAEPARQEVMEFDITGDYIGSYIKSDHHIPTEIYQIDLNSIVGSRYQNELM